MAISWNPKDEIEVENAELKARKVQEFFFNEAQPPRHLENLGKSMTHIQDCTLWFGILWSLRPNDVEICWRALLQEKMRHMEESIKQAKGRGREISCSCFVHSVCIMHPYHIIATKRLVVWFSRNNAKFYGICTRYPLGWFTTGWTTLRQSNMAMDAMEHLHL